MDARAKKDALVRIANSPAPILIIHHEEIVSTFLQRVNTKDDVDVVLGK